MQKPTLLALALLCSALPSFADDPQTSHITPVSWIVATRNNSDVDDKHVVLVGHITRQDGDDWWFTDGSGSVRLATGDLELPVGPQLVIHGVIDHADLGIFGHLEVEVKNWSYAGKARHATPPSGNGS